MKFKTEINITNILILIIVLIFFIWFFLFGGATYLQEASRNIFGGEKIIKTNVSIDCTDFNLPQEFRDEYGNSAINNARLSCWNLNGIWKEYNNEISCTFDPSGFSMAFCGSAIAINADDFCANELGGTWLCSSQVAYVGCYCDKEEPLPCSEFCYEKHYDFGINYDGIMCAPEEDLLDYCCCWNEEDKPEGIPCENTFPECDGGCDFGMWCIENEIGTGCTCIADTYTDSDCSTYCINRGQGYTGGYKVHSSQDCQAGDTYDDGCCCIREQWYCCKLGGTYDCQEGECAVSAQYGPWDEIGGPYTTETDCENSCYGNCAADWDCPTGYKCFAWGSESECRRDCSDTDGGINFQVKGTCTDWHTPGVFEDWCAPHLVEYYCGDSSYSWMDGSVVKECDVQPSGCDCVDGACPGEIQYGGSSSNYIIDWTGRTAGQSPDRFGGLFGGWAHICSGCCSGDEAYVKATLKLFNYDGSDCYSYRYSSNYVLSADVDISVNKRINLDEWLASYNGQHMTLLIETKFASGYIRNMLIIHGTV